MEYFENALRLEDYRKLRESVGWLNFNEEQTARALCRSLYTILVVSEGQTVGMGRLIGDGVYDTIVDVVVAPDYQKAGIGTQIMNRLLAYIEENTPAGGRTSVQLIAEKGKEGFYKTLGFQEIPNAHCGSGMRKIFRK